MIVEALPSAGSTVTVAFAAFISCPHKHLATFSSTATA